MPLRVLLPLTLHRHFAESALDCVQHYLEALILLVEDDDAYLRVAPCRIREELIDSCKKCLLPMPNLTFCDICSMPFERNVDVRLSLSAKRLTSRIFVMRVEHRKDVVTKLLLFESRIGAWGLLHHGTASVDDVGYVLIVGIADAIGRSLRRWQRDTERQLLPW